MTDGIAFHTPDFDGNAPLVCRRLALPSFLWQYFNGAFGALIEEQNWYQFGDMPIEDVVQAFINAYDDMVGGCMIGSVVPFVTENMPDNVLLCDGTNYLRVDYPALYDLLDPILIIDADTFKTPNLTGRLPLGEDVGNHDLDDIGGAETHSLQVEEMPAHSHGYTPPIANVDLETPGAPDIFAAGVGIAAQTSVEGGGNPHNNMPPYYVVRYGLIAK